MSEDIYNFPDQTIPETKKNKEWHMRHGREYISGLPTSGYSNAKEEIEQMYRTYLCLVNEEEKELLKPVTSPHGTNLGVEYMVYNLAEQKVEQLIGDYMDRPLKKKSYVMNKDSINRKLDAKITMLTEKWFREKNEEFEREHGITLSTENPEIEIPENVEEFFSKKYKDIAEETHDDLMEKFLDVDKQSREIIPALRDFLISDQAHMKIYEEDGIVKWQKSSPLECDPDIDPHKTVQDNHDRVSEIHYMTLNDIYNSYELDAKQKESVEHDFKYIQNFTAGKITGTPNSWVNDRGWYAGENKSFRLAVLQMTWKSRKMLRVKVSKNKHTGEDIYKKLSDKDKVKKSDNVITHGIEVERYVVMIGPNTCLDYGLGEYRNYRLGNRKKCYLNFVSIYRQNPLGVRVCRSVVAKLKKLQDWASENLFELRAAMRRNQGKVMIYDTAQIPRSYLQGGKKSAYSNALNKVMHHVKKDNIIFINSKERNNRYNYNQFQSVDMSTSGLINDIIAGFSLIESLADKILGLSPERQGNTEKYATATSTDASRKASFSRTEIFYRPFDDFLQTCMERVSMLSKQVYKEGELIHFTIGDMESKYLSIAPEFSDSDIGWYLSDGSKDFKKKQIIDQAAQLALGNAQTEEMILSLIDVLSQDTSVESRAILERAVNAGKKLREQNEAAQQEQFKQQLDQNASKDKRDDDTKRRGQDMEPLVATIYANQKNRQVDKQEGTKLITNLAKFEADTIKKYQEPQKAS